MAEYSKYPPDLGAGVRLLSSMDGTHDPITGVRTLTSGGVALGSVTLPVQVINHVDSPIVIGGTIGGDITAAPGEHVYVLKDGLVLTVRKSSPLTPDQHQTLVDTITGQINGFQKLALDDELADLSVRARNIAGDIAADPTIFHWHRCNTIDEMQTFYLSRLPAIREAARVCGYAIGLHGSMRRDFDLIAVPWVADYGTKDALAKTIQHAACGLSRETYEWEQKPHGRMATAFPICWTEWHDMISAGHIDLSVMVPAPTTD